MAFTPMMTQYLEIKEQYRDYVLFYRLGDFYEMFFEDAQMVSRELDLTLTGRDCGEKERAPMCGVPYHASDVYIGKLIAAGHKVAICEQVEDPALAKGLVKREVVRVITPGTVIESDLLSETKNNYLAAIYVEGNTAGVCFADISTAYVCAVSFDGADFEQSLLNEVSTYAPREVLLNVSLADLPMLAAWLSERGVSVSDGLRDVFRADETVARAEQQFRLSVSETNKRTALIAAGAAVGYIMETQKSEVSYLNTLNIYESNQFLEMDTATRRNLELTETMLTKEKRGSLLWVLDKTTTAMGARMLRDRIEHPLTNVGLITRRQEAVEELAGNFMLREEMRDLLSGVLDLERLMTKVTYGSAGGRDLRAIAQTLSVLPDIRSLLGACQSAELSRLRDSLDDLSDVCAMINAAIVDEPPFPIREGGMIRDGYSAEVDELRDIKAGGKDRIHAIEEREKELTGIKNLRINYNRVFGYYIEVTRSQLDLVPEHYIRKQTLSGAERYITQELKDYEATVLGAEDKLRSLEYELFVRLRDEVAAASDRIRASALHMAELDFYTSLGQVAVQNNYTCPVVDYSDALEIKDGRHPVVEQFVRDSYFVPNDVSLNTGDRRLLLITGPNMAGKSTYMRQVALIVLMAQLGSFVPASDARIGVVDKVFTRVGASDDLASGQSTFMLEMKEVAYILKNATRRSFIIYDEIGRGTSTYDGMSIARAVAEFTAGRKLGAKTMFATHYHELTTMADEMEGVVNCNVAAKKRGDDVTFLRKIVPGPADDSYGIEVAKLAGVRPEIIKRAKEILSGLESGSGAPAVKSGGKRQKEFIFPDAGMNLSLSDGVMEEVREQIRTTDINTLTPIEAMNLIFEWKKRLM